MMKRSTQTIAGHTVTLQSGVRYFASRPWARRGVRSFDVTVEAVDVPGAPRVVIARGLSFDAANELLAAFNDGSESFDGRVWQ
jgi:hypothetical protein